MPFVEFIKSVLNHMLWDAARAGAKSVEITAADLRDRLPSLRPGLGDQIPVCYQVMWAALSLDAGDTSWRIPRPGRRPT